MKDSFRLPLERTVLHPLFWRFRGRKNRAIFSSSQGLFSEALWSYLGRDWCYWLVRRKKKKQHKGSSEWPRPVFGLCQSPMGNYSRQYFFFSLVLKGLARIARSAGVCRPIKDSMPTRIYSWAIIHLWASFFFALQTPFGTRQCDQNYLWQVRISGWENGKGKKKL